MKLKNYITGGDKLGNTVTLGIQHVFAMFGSTVLVPALTGLDPALTLLCMGLGTLIFHLVTKGIVPAFMGSSFSFISAICSVAAQCSKNGISEFAPYVGWGILASGLLYVILSLLVKLWGAKRITGFFPPVVTGCMIIIIGMMLAPTAMNNITTVQGDLAAETQVVIDAETPAENGYYFVSELKADGSTGISGWVHENDLLVGESTVISNEDGISLLNEPAADASTISGTLTWKHWVVAIFTVAVIILVMFFARGFFKLIPILFGIVGGYLLSLALGLVDVTPVKDAAWVALPKFSFLKFDNWDMIGFSISMIAPISIVTFVEHVGDITANGAVTGNNYIEKPGLHRTLLGCGFASIFSGMLGGPAATTYSENTGVLAATRNYNPATLRFAALFAIVLSLFGKVSGVLSSIPTPVMGGVSIVLFGMIASVGLRMLVENAVDFTKSRNLIIAAVMLVIGLGLSSGITFGSVSISGTAIAAVLGVILNKILPKEES